MEPGYAQTLVRDRCAGNPKSRRDCSVIAGNPTKSAVSSATAELFNACRVPPPDPKLQKRGWLCPVPKPAEGEDDNYIHNCKHVAFSSVVHVRKHFWDEHWDFGVWEGKPRPLRTSRINNLKCKCQFDAFTLREMDEHVIIQLARGVRGCGPRLLHHHELIPIRHITSHATGNSRLLLLNLFEVQWGTREGAQAVHSGNDCHLTAVVVLPGVGSGVRGTVVAGWRP